MPYVNLPARQGAAPLSVHYRITGRADAKHTLVCVHELGGSLKSFEQLLARLPAEIRIITFDQRGAGRSEHTVANFAVDDLAADIHALADSLGVRTFHLMGMAMGAVVALKAATRLQGRLESLVLCDATGEITPEAREYILRRAVVVREQGMRPVVDASLSNAFRGIEVDWDEPLWATYRQRFLGNAPLSYALLSEALAQVCFDDRELANVTCPTLVLTGRNDFIWPPENGRRLAARLPNARFEEIAESSHFPPLQSPNVVAAIVTSFVQLRAS